jgi:hypothetical protein
MSSVNRLAMIAIGFVCLSGGGRLMAAPPVSLAGRWSLNRQLSQFPKEVGFGITMPSEGPVQGGRSSSGGGGGGRRRGGSSGGVGQSGSSGLLGAESVRESEEDAKKIKELIAEAKDPSPILNISQTETTVTVTDSQDRMRAFHPNGKEETQEVGAGPFGGTARWKGQQLVVQFTIRKDRSFQYTYSRSPTGQLIVETRLDDGRRRERDEVITRVYDVQR